MKASSTGSLTAALIASLLVGSGICFALRHSADERRAHEARPVPGSPVIRADRDAAAAGAARTRLGDRDAFRQRLFRQMSSGDPMTRSQNLVELIDGLDPADFPVFFEEMKKLCKNGDPVLLLALSAWAEVDPAAALEQELKWNKFWDSTVLKIWVERDPVSALGWLAENDKPGAVVDQALRALVSDDPAAALAWAKSHDEPMRGDLTAHARLAAVLQAMLPRHLKEVIGEFPQLPAETRKSLIAPVSTRIGQLSAEERLQWLESFPPGEPKNETVAAMISGMGTLDERLKLLADYPGALDKPGTAELYNQWVTTDRQAALESLEKLPSGPSRNAAVAAAVEGLARQGEPRQALDVMNRYPEAVEFMGLMDWVTIATMNKREWELALATAGRVGNEGYRESIYRYVLNSWLSSHREAARAWLDSNNDELPESIRTAFEQR